MPDTSCPTSAIVRVDMFRTNALVTRQIQIAPGTLSGEAPEIRIPGLPVALADLSVRARLPAGCPVKVSSLHVALEAGARERPLRTEREEEMRALRKEREAILVEVERVVQGLKAWRALGETSVSAVELPEDLAFRRRECAKPWLGLAQTVEEALNDGQGRIRELSKKLLELGDRLSQAEHRARMEGESLRLARETFHKAVHIAVERLEARQELALELSYLVPAVTWFPQYELRVQDDADRAELVLQALVAQKTGEDWRGVELALSTADLRRSADLPVLDSWRISKEQPTRKTGWRAPPIPRTNRRTSEWRRSVQDGRGGLHQALELGRLQAVLGQRALLGLVLAGQIDHFLVQLGEVLVLEQIRAPRVLAQHGDLLG